MNKRGPRARIEEDRAALGIQRLRFVSIQLDCNPFISLPGGKGCHLIESTVDSSWLSTGYSSDFLRGDRLMCNLLLAEKPGSSSVKRLFNCSRNGRNVGPRRSFAIYSMFFGVRVGL
jgi:hypothetical protein